MTDYIVDVNEQNAQQLLIDESFKRPVVVDFWADWCQPCKTLMPLLEKLAHEFAGAFLLAKINADEQQMLASQLGVRNLPTVMVIKDGQPIDGFSGAQPESIIRDILEKYLPKPWDKLLEQAAELVALDNHTDALHLLRQAYNESGHRNDIGMQLAGVLLKLKRLDEAETLLQGVKLADQNQLFQQLTAQLDLAREAGHSAAIEALQTQLNANPDDLDLRYQLAVQFSQEDHQSEALELLFSILQRERDHQDGATKKALLKIIATLGKGDPLATQYQRKLFGLLH